MTFVEANYDSNKYRVNENGQTLFDAEDREESQQVRKSSMYRKALKVHKYRVDYKKRTGRKVSREEAAKNLGIGEYSDGARKWASEVWKNPKVGQEIVNSIMQRIQYLISSYNDAASWKKKNITEQVIRNLECLEWVKNIFTVPRQFLREVYSWLVTKDSTGVVDSITELDVTSTSLSELSKNFREMVFPSVIFKERRVSYLPRADTIVA